MDKPDLRQIVTNSITFWERCRVVYNVVLALVVVIVFLRPEANQTFSLALLKELFVLAVLANVAYCTAYFIDIFVQVSDLRNLWLRMRWLLFFVGLLFATVIAVETSWVMFVKPV